MVVFAEKQGADFNSRFNTNLDRFDVSFWCSAVFTAL